MSNKQDYKFEGWMGLDKESVDGKMKWQAFEPKKWEETDVDIEITHCGICGSDIHTLRSGWARQFPSNYPVCVGHEIVGKAVRVGSEVKHVKVGDIVGVGAQCDACLNNPSRRINKDKDCPNCKDGQESYCQKMVGTYDSKHFNGDKSYGGYATHTRKPGHFVIPIPSGLDPADAAPMLCGGVTCYSPLKNWGAGPGKTVAILGVGGLGHFGVLFAKALKCDKVIAMSRRENKREDAMKLGADVYIATEDEKDWAKKWASSCDLIVSTVSSSKMPINDYLGMLKRDGTLVQVGAPEDGLPTVSPFPLIMGRRSIAGSAIGPPAQITEMLKLAADQKIKPWVEKVPMKDANKAIVDMENGKARYRYVLVNDCAGKA